ncbi:MAG: hypothetical protein RRY55_06450, partial [Bacteroidales bacterium]
MKKKKETDYRRFNNVSLLPCEGREKEIKTIKNFIYDTSGTLDMAHKAWDEIKSYREGRVRSRDYTFGKQWNDTITLPDGRTMTEEQYLKEQGKVPLKNNLIRQLIKNVVGQFRSTQTQPVCVARDRKEQPLGEVLSCAIDYVSQHNRVWEIDGRSFEEFLISGSCFHKIFYGTRYGKTDVWIDEVSPARVFFNIMEDSRHWDCTLVGEIHDLPISILLSRFAKGSLDRATDLRGIYTEARETNFSQRYKTLSNERIDNLDFLVPADDNCCRVIEVWRYESREKLRCHDTLSGSYYKAEISTSEEIEKENLQRVKTAAKQGVTASEVPLIKTEWFVDMVWHYRFMSPLGHILDEGETPYWHGSHPYSFKLYPLIDGEIHSFVEDIIDQQRYINRLITLVDFIMGSSAKGVLLFPEDQIPDGMTIEDVADEWTRYNGVILFKPKPGAPLPQQIAVNATNVGAYELLNLQIKLFEDISGVHGAMQGKGTAPGTAYALYAQQIQNSALNLVDIFESFKCFRLDRDTKLMKTIQQFYDKDRYLQIVGSIDEEKLDKITSEEVRNAEFDISITEAVSSPVYRVASNEFLLELFRMKQITLEMLLENGSFPFADKLLQSIEKEKNKESLPSSL